MLFRSLVEPVIKFITVRIDEEEKRLAKVKALRGVRRSATPTVAPASAAEPALETEEAAELA